MSTYRITQSSFPIASWHFINAQLITARRRPLSKTEFCQLAYPKPLPWQLPLDELRQRVEESVLDYFRRFVELVNLKFPFQYSLQDTFYPCRYVEFNGAWWFYLGLNPILQESFYPCYHLTFKQVLNLAAQAEGIASQEFSPVPKEGLVFHNNFTIWNRAETTNCLFGDKCYNCTTQATFDLALAFRFAISEVTEGAF